MAIDTQEKRAGVMSIGRPFMRNTFPTGTLDEQERMSIGNVYGGNALSPGGATFSGGYHYYYNLLRGRAY